MSVVDYSEKIPNNVNLSSDRRLQRALEKWQPAFLDWWDSVGPQVFKTDEVYLRTAISTQPGGWANFGHVRMPDYRWGIFLADKEQDRVIPGGDDAGKPVWQEVPGEHRNALKRIIVVQADTEPASVEQQRWLAASAPSLYDARNLFQVNVEEARHLWAMVYLLHAHFGKDGRDEADALLERRSGDEDKPRILDAFNQPCREWLSFFCFTMFTDRDGKFQLASLAESAFDPLSRSCRFMLTEEAHHLFVGDTGLDRIIRRAAQLTKQDPNGDARAQGGIDLPTIQKWINYWFSYCLDLFGAEVSTNAADYFAAGLKGRYREARAYSDHLARSGVMNVPHVENDTVVDQEISLRLAMNEILRDEYIADCEKSMQRWNKTLEAEGVSDRLYLPNRRFHRRQGLYANHSFDVEGNLISADAFEARRNEWLPTEDDRDYVESLMVGVHEPGKMANWIAAPRKGINNQALEFEYVRTDG
ncbi:MAG: benzoyl-CoA 2,3-epoxidase subunit BoxB [Deltaproteobacteria bacterium]|nr:MAG: benzoyl-CoA 2,3-epoxidase subunit BoxB [Deltaproteobacteria bacterium]